MKPIKLKFDDFKKNELVKENKRMITGGAFTEEKNIQSLYLESTIDPPKIEKPMGQS